MVVADSGEAAVAGFAGDAAGAVRDAADARGVTVGNRASCEPVGVAAAEATASVAAAFSLGPTGWSAAGAFASVGALLAEFTLSEPEGPFVGGGNPAPTAPFSGSAAALVFASPAVGFPLAGPGFAFRDAATFLSPAGFFASSATTMLTT